MKPKHSTLLTSPASQADFVLRLAFFATAPLVIVGVATQFPVLGALVDVLLALGVFILSETIRKVAGRNKWVRLALSHALEFENYYHQKLPRTFLYYAAYPLIFPYWLINREARKEFLMFRSYTVSAFLILLGTLVFQYYYRWLPELGMEDFLPVVLVTIVVETLLVLWLLMPLATSVVWYHASFRRKRLTVVLLVALASTTVTVWRITTQRDPIVSFSARKRITLRTEAVKERAHKVLFDAANQALAVLREHNSMPVSGMITGAPLEAAHDTLSSLYKSDEVRSFELHIFREGKDELLLLHTSPHRRQKATWMAVTLTGAEVSELSALPERLRKMAFDLPK